MSASARLLLVALLVPEINYMLASSVPSTGSLCEAEGVAGCDKSNDHDRYTIAAKNADGSIERKEASASSILGSDKLGHPVPMKQVDDKKKQKKKKKKKKKSSNKKHDDEFGLGLWWFAPFLSGGGYSSEAIAFATALSDRVNLRVTHHGDSPNRKFLDGLPDETVKVLKRLANPKKANVDPSKSVVICHSEPGAWNPPKYETELCPPREEPLYTIGRTMFETDRIPAGWKSRCNNMDEIWVPTEFHKDTFAKSGIALSKLVVIPEPVDTNRFDPQKFPNPDHSLASFAAKPITEKGPNRIQDCFKFLSIFKWESRKGWDILLSAYVQQFSFEDPVALILLTNPFHIDGSLQKIVQDYVNKEIKRTNKVAPTIYIIDEHISESQLPLLYRSVDCFVLPSRGEGWGRPHVEAMSMGLPVIATNWSGPTAFLTQENGYPLEFDNLVTVPDGAFSKHHKWAEPNKDHLRLLMKEVVNDKAGAERKGKRARQDMVQQYSPNVVATIVLKRLQAIKERLEEDGALD